MVEDVEKYSGFKEESDEGAVGQVPAGAVAIREGAATPATATGATRRSSRKRGGAKLGPAHQQQRPVHRRFPGAGGAAAGAERARGLRADSRRGVRAAVASTAAARAGGNSWRIAAPTRTASTCFRSTSRSSKRSRRPARNRPASAGPGSNPGEQHRSWPRRPRRRKRRRCDRRCCTSSTTRISTTPMTT